MSEAVDEMVARIAAEAPRMPGIDWGVALAVSIIRTLDKENPGFRERVRETVLYGAATMESSGDPDQVADAPSMRELAESWIFTETRDAD